MINWTMIIGGVIFIVGFFWYARSMYGAGKTFLKEIDEYTRKGVRGNLLPALMTVIGAIVFFVGVGQYVRPH